MNEYPDARLLKGWEELPQMPSTQFLRRLQGLSRILAQKGGLVVTCNGRPDAVVISANDYDRLVSFIKANEPVEGLTRPSSPGPG